MLPLEPIVKPSTTAREQGQQSNLRHLLWPLASSDRWAFLSPLAQETTGHHKEDGVDIFGTGRVVWWQNA